MSEYGKYFTINKDIENIINNNEEKKVLKPLKKIIGFFNVIILINFFILQFSNVLDYFQILLNELIFIYLWIEIREVKIKLHIQKIKLIFILLFFYSKLYLLFIIFNFIIKTKVSIILIL